MTESASLWKFRPLDVPWIFVGYCFFLVFHLLPSYFIADANVFSFGREFELIPTIWLFCGLAGVSYYIGLRSRGVTIAEPGISAVAYAVTFTFASDYFTGQEIGLRSVGTMYVVAVCIFTIAVVSAWLGEKVQIRREESRRSME